MNDGVAPGYPEQGEVPLPRNDPGRKLRMGFVLDVAGWGSRPAPLQSGVQRRLPELVERVLARCGLRLSDGRERTADCAECEWNGTGDGINTMLPADMDPTLVLPVLIRTLAVELVADNARNSDRMRMRMAVGIGLAEGSGVGFGGPLVLEINRLCSSRKLHQVLADESAADLVVAITDVVHSIVIKPGYPGIPAAQFEEASVAEKEFSGTAWIWISTRQWSAAPYDRPDQAADPQRVGGYQVAARIPATGGAGAGRVYLASAPNGRWDAVKVFDPGIVAYAGARQRLEAGVLSGQLARGPRLASIVADGEESGRRWIASTLVRGPSLDAAVTETGPLPARSTLWLAVGVAQAVAALHEDDLAHGGLTPSNVLLHAEGPMVTDAGVNRTALTSSWPATEADDVFALGSVVFFAATGRSSGDADSPGDADLTGCPSELLPFVTECLDADPARRPSAHALALRLSAAAGQPPRSWLPPAIVTRLEEYKDLPETVLGPRSPFRLLRGRPRGGLR